MTLAEFVAACDGGDVLIAAKEIVTEGIETVEKLIVSFNRSEKDAIKSEIMERTVSKFRAEVQTGANAVQGRTYALTMVAILDPAAPAPTTPPSGGGGTSGSGGTGE